MSQNDGDASWLESSSDLGQRDALRGTRSSRDRSFLSRRWGRLRRARGLSHGFHPGCEVAKEQRRQLGDDDAEMMSGSCPVLALVARRVATTTAESASR